MKHDFLRRLSALFLALVMAVSLCAAPAWAADGDSGTTNQLSLSTELIVLQDSSSTWPLTITGVTPGNTVKWTTTGTVQVSSSETTVEENASSCMVNVSFTGNSTEGTVQAAEYDANDNIISSYLICYVCGGHSPLQVTDQIDDLTVGREYTLTASVTEDRVKNIFDDAEITVEPVPASYATVGATSYNKNTGTFSVSITGTQTGRITIFMTLPGGYQYSWIVNIKSAPGTVDVDYLGFNNVPSTISLIVGQTYSMPEPIISPENATNKEVEWKCSSENIATVDNKGKITAVSQGIATVTATAKGGKVGLQPVEFTVRVTDAPFSLEVAPQSGASAVIDLRTGISKGTTTTIQANMSGLNSSEAKVTRWISSNQNVAFLTNPSSTERAVEITGKAGGTTNITAYVTYTDANGRQQNTSAYCTVTVLDDKSVEITKIDLSKTTYTMPADGVFTLTATVSPSNALAKSVTWDSSNKAVATVDENGKVEAHEAGETIIIAKAIYGNLSNSCKLTVTPISETIRLTPMPDLVNTSVGSGRYRYTFKNGPKDTTNFTAVLTPTGAADPVRWASKNEGIAKVEYSASKTTQAKITAVSPGKTTITAIPLDAGGKDRTLASGPMELAVTVSGLAIEDTEQHALTSLSLMANQRQELVASIYGSAYNGDNSVDWTSYDPSIVAVSAKSGASTTITARAPGTTTVTARKGSYMATLTVTVLEDTVGVITGSTAPGAPFQFQSILSQLQTACTTKTGKSLAYITNLAVASTDQGILHDQHHSSADTGAGVGVQDRYYASAGQGQSPLSDLSFVPRNTFSGTAQISYTGWSTDNKAFNGVIRISVNGTGDVMYASTGGSVVYFSADDFNVYHPGFRSVSFTPPQSNVGTLYYSYTDASQPGTKVSASDSYSRTGTPSLDRVAFVPATGYNGTAKISYRGTDSSGNSMSGTVTITMTGNDGGAKESTDITYGTIEDLWTAFAPTDFNSRCLAALGEQLSYVRFTPPPSSDGTLFYNYRGFGSYDSMVTATTSYYFGGTPSLSNVVFVPTTTTPSQVDIAYTGYSVRGNTFTGTIHIGRSTAQQEQGGLRYTVFTGKTVNLSAYDLNRACIDATRASLSYVVFGTTSTTVGSLRYRTNSSSTNGNALSSSTRCYYSSTTGSSAVLVDNVFFQAGFSTGTATIPFTGYNTNGQSFTGAVVIQVTPPTTGSIDFYGTTASPFRLSGSRVRSACSGVLDGTLSYITFTSLPASTSGKLYLDYSGFGTGTLVNTGVRYYVSGSPSIDRLSFVPQGRYDGTVSAGYTATNTSGQSVTGTITFHISGSGGSSYFTDIGSWTWAAPSIDYLYQNGVTNGVTPTTFGPTQNIQRCDFVVMLCRAFGFTGGSGYSFADVPTNAYYSNAVATAKQLGIINGDGRNFMPNSPITRQDAMVIIKNAMVAAGWNVAPASTSVLGRFVDGNSVATYARDAVSTLVQLGAVNGSNGYLNPYSTISRGEAAVILHFVMTM